MQRAEAQRKQNRRGPEANPISQSELGVAASEEFFVEAYDQKEPGPEHCKFQRAHTVQCESPEIKSMGSAQRHQQQSERHDSPQRAHPEKLAEGLARRQAVAAEWPAFDLATSAAREPSR